MEIVGDDGGCSVVGTVDDIAVVDDGEWFALGGFWEPFVEDVLPELEELFLQW